MKVKIRKEDKEDTVLFADMRMRKPPLHIFWSGLKYFRGEENE